MDETTQAAPAAEHPSDPGPHEAAQSALADLQPSEPPAPEPEGAPNQRAEQPDPEPTPDPEPDEADEGEASGSPRLELDKLFDERLKDQPELLAEVKKRWAEQSDGIAKRESQLAHAETALQEYEADKPALEVLRSYAEAFNDPQVAPQAVQALVSQLAHLHGTTVEALVGGTNPSSDYPLAPGLTSMKPAHDEQGNPYADFERRGWESQGEMELAALSRRQSAVIEQLESRLRALEGDFVPLKNAAQSQRQQADLNEYIARETPAAAARLKREFAGFKVTEHMVRKAVERYPQHRADPAKAVEAAYSKAIAQHMSAHSAQNSRRGPEMIPASGSRGRQHRDMAAMSPSEAARFARQQLEEAGKLGP